VRRRENNAGGTAVPGRCDANSGGKIEKFLPFLVIQEAATARLDHKWRCLNQGRRQFRHLSVHPKIFRRYRAQISYVHITIRGIVLEDLWTVAGV
jgi:hypothetical protein